MSLVLEGIGLAIPIGFQLVLDDVVVSDDRDLLTLIALGLGLVLAFRALIDLVRSWAIMVAGIIAIVAGSLGRIVRTQRSVKSV